MNSTLIERIIDGLIARKLVAEADRNAAVIEALHQCLACIHEQFVAYVTRDTESVYRDKTTPGRAFTMDTGSRIECQKGRG